MSVRAAYARADRYLREHRWAYVGALFVAAFAVNAGLYVVFGAPFGRALLRGAINGFVFAAVLGLPSYVVGTRTA